MRYFYEKPDYYIPIYGEIYNCDHPLYDQCTLYSHGEKGLAVIQERFEKATKIRYYSSIDPWLANDIYLNEGFWDYFKEHAEEPYEGLYPTVTVRQIMWALRMKPLKKEWWEITPRKNYNAYSGREAE